MQRFDVQSVEIAAPASAVYDYLSNPNTLPEWTHAFSSVEDGHAMLVTPKGSVAVGLEVQADRESGTVDWIMRFPDGTEGRACSRVVALTPNDSVYSFVLFAPPVPLEAVEGALAEQSVTLGRELARLQDILDRRRP
jgi:hypothetical protein